MRLLPDEWGKGNIDYIPKKRNLLTMRITELYHRYMSKVLLNIMTSSINLQTENIHSRRSGRLPSQKKYYRTNIKYSK